MEIRPEIFALLREGALILFYILTLVFILFTVATAYHWFRFGSSKATNVLALAIFLCLCTPLFIAMTLLLSLM